MMRSEQVTVMSLHGDHNIVGARLQELGKLKSLPLSEKESRKLAVNGY